MKSVIAGWKRQPLSMRLLRGFLGLTFIYAGLDKLLDPSFIPQGFVESVSAYAQTSPISSLLSLAAEHPTLFAWVIIISELSIGIFTLLGAAALPAALGGMLLSLTLWLSSSWNVRPYFLAADPAYLVMWSVYAFSLPRSKKAFSIERREAGVAFVGALAVGAIAFFGRRSKKQVVEPTASASGKTVVALANLPVGSTFAFDSSQGPAVLIRLADNKVVAYTTKCTHEGCTVQFNRGRKLLECPCHGATFDPSREAAPTPPASRPLSKIQVAIKGANVVEV